MNVLFRALSVDAFENRVWGLDMDYKIVRHEVIFYNNLEF